MIALGIICTTIVLLVLILSTYTYKMEKLKIDNKDDKKKVK